MINNTINIKFEKDRYTTPITIEFRKKKLNEHWSNQTSSWGIRWDALHRLNDENDQQG